MKAEIITIGDELLLGQTIDTNSVYIAKVLAPLGINIHYKQAISDSKDAIIGSLEISIKRSKLIIITGGLGPTKDDITKHTLTEYFNSDWRWDEEVLHHLENIFSDRGRELLDINKQQAMLPALCETLFNQKGTAPGMLFKVKDTWIASLPGVPYEVVEIMEQSLIPKLKSEFDIKPIINKTLTTALIPESKIAQKLIDFEDGIANRFSLAYLPSYNIVKIRLNALNQSITQTEFDKTWDKLIDELGEWVADTTDSPISEQWARMLKENNFQISTAESCTGGYIGNQLVSVAGASSYFQGSVISYANEIKSDVLKIDSELIKKHGAVSKEVAIAMVEGASRIMNTPVAVSTTGIAGPTGGTEDKPVGTIWIAIKINDHISVEQYKLRGTRTEFMLRAFNTAYIQFKNLLKDIK
jgi:nicotinamide-nucleotide amidase